MTGTFRVDAVAADEAMLDLVADRAYAGDDPLGGLLLSFAVSCDQPSPAMPLRARRRRRRVLVSAFATAALLTSGAGVAAAVTDHLPPFVAEAKALLDGIGWLAPSSGGSAGSGTAEPGSATVVRSTGAPTMIVIDPATGAVLPEQAESAVPGVIVAEPSSGRPDGVPGPTVTPTGPPPTTPPTTPPANPPVDPPADGPGNAPGANPGNGNGVPGGNANPGGNGHAGGNPGSGSGGAAGGGSPANPASAPIRPTR